MHGTSLPAQNAAPEAPAEPSGPRMVIPEEPSSSLLGIAVALSLMLHGGAVYFAFPRGGQQGAIEQETTAISVNLTRTEVVRSIPSPDETDQAPSNQGAGQPEPEAPVPEKETPIAEEDTRLAAEREKAEAEAETRARAETEAREKAEAEAREKAEATSRIQAEQEARLKAEEQARFAAEAEARLKAEAEARQKEQEEAQRLAEAEQRRKEEAERKAEAERQREAEEERREAREDERREAEREARRKASAKARAQGEVNSAAKTAGRVSASSGQIISYNARVRARAAANTSGVGIRGRVVVAFGLTESGGVTYARIQASSGNPALDRAALASLRRAAPFPAAPAGISARQRQFTVPITFR